MKRVTFENANEIAETAVFCIQDVECGESVEECQEVRFDRKTLHRFLNSMFHTRLTDDAPLSALVIVAQSCGYHLLMQEALPYENRLRLDCSPIVFVPRARTGVQAHS